MKIFGLNISQVSEEAWLTSRIATLECALSAKREELRILNEKNLELSTTVSQLTHEKESALKNLDCVKGLYARVKTRSIIYRTLLKLITKEDNPTASSIISIVETMESLQEGIKKDAKMP